MYCGCLASEPSRQRRAAGVFRKSLFMVEQFTEGVRETGIRKRQVYPTPIQLIDRKVCAFLAHNVT